MAKVGGPKDFVNVLKSVSVSEIVKEANRPISVAVVGGPERRNEAIASLFTEGSETPGNDLVKVRALPESPFVQGFDSFTEESGFPQQQGVFDLAIDLGVGREGASEGLLIYSLNELGGWENTLKRILEDRPDLALALARSFPIFRKEVAQRIIQQTATANAQFALLTGVTAAFPLLGALLPVNSLSDIVILTKNQAMMVLRLAAAYGLPVDYRSRFKELAPILGNAFGWRAIARELVGAIPFGGFLAKAMIAYAGTVTIGRASQIYYETGETVSVSQAKRFYHEAYEASREKVRAMASALRREGGGKRRAAVTQPAETPALPKPEEVIETSFLPEREEAAIE